MGTGKSTLLSVAKNDLGIAGASVLMAVLQRRTGLTCCLSGNHLTDLDVAVLKAEGFAPGVQLTL